VRVRPGAAARAGDARLLLHECGSTAGAQRPSEIVDGPASLGHGSQSIRHTKVAVFALRTQAVRATLVHDLRGHALIAHSVHRLQLTSSPGPCARSNRCEAVRPCNAIPRCCAAAPFCERAFRVVLDTTRRTKIELGCFALYTTTAACGCSKNFAIRTAAGEITIEIIIQMHTHAIYPPDVRQDAARPHLWAGAGALARLAPGVLHGRDGLWMLDPLRSFAPKLFPTRAYHTPDVQGAP
jgi:hypothetical protein